MAFTYTFSGSTKLQGQGGDPVVYAQSFSKSSDTAIGNGEFSASELSDATCDGGSFEKAIFQVNSGTGDNIMVCGASSDGSKFNTYYIFSEGAFSTAGSYDSTNGDMNPNGQANLSVSA